MPLHSNRETADSKPASAKTITLRSNGSATVTIPEYNQDDTKSNAVASKNETNAEDDPEEEEKAATKIQAVFRGHKTRKSMKQPAGKVEPTTPSSQEPTREELEAEFRLDDAELCHAATKIQASFRGHMTRKEQDKQGGKKEDESSTSQAQAQEEEELDIDLTDPELNKAAVKIQASFRGHMTRKDEKN
ncbi:unnamed protein product [Psylliodes chrysocephalus]|uniref:Neuromodulin n=1 Tax=Psylliodes chrysocephalus TaxID=3402493 RepID=A0A9P0CZP7_9CUCU|nr:unnamed protein product [Psylliodes chrysocephala]